MSVVIPTFERGAPLRRALESVAMQRVAEMEVIVVDDGSADASAIRAASEGISGINVRVVRHDHNRGGAAARNTGVANARGRYVAFLDSDDEWLPSKISSQLEVADRQPDDCWLSYCRTVMKTSQRDTGIPEVWPSRGKNSGESVGDYLFVAGGFMPTPSFFLPRRLALTVPFNESLRRHQDYDFVLRLEKEGCRFMMVDDPLVVVHWEDFHDTQRGFSPQGSLAFLKNYHQFLSPRARSGFVLQQIVIRALRTGLRREGWLALLRHVRLMDVTMRDWINILSLTMHGDVRVTRSLARLKRRLRRRA